MLRLLSKNSLTISGRAENFDMSRPAVSKHIKILHGVGFIAIEDKGRKRYCSLKHEGFKKPQQWTDYFDKFWAARPKNRNTILKNKAKSK